MILQVQVLAIICKSWLCRRLTKLPNEIFAAHLRWFLLLLLQGLFWLLRWRSLLLIFSWGTLVELWHLLLLWFSTLCFICLHLVSLFRDLLCLTRCLSSIFPCQVHLALSFCIISRSCRWGNLLLLAGRSHIWRILALFSCGHVLVVRCCGALHRLAQIGRRDAL